MYAFMYVYPQIIPVEDHFPADKQFVVKYNKMSTPGPVPKYLLVFSYVRSEDYDLDQKFNATELKEQTDNTSNN